MANFYVDNAIAWAQFRRNGGMGTFVAVIAGYAVLVVAVMILVYELNPFDRTQLMSGCAHFLLGLECLFAAVFGSSRAGSAIRQDITSKVMESHRLMPLSARAAICGYLVGTNVTVAGLCGASFVLGAIAAGMGSMPISNWILVQMVLAVFTLMVASLTALIAYAARGAGWLIVILFAVSLMSGGAVFQLAPGMMMVCSPLIGRTIFESGLFQVQLPQYAVAMLGQLILTAVFIQAASRKYERDAAMALTVRARLIVLAVWVGLSLYGMIEFDQLSPFGAFGRGGSESVIPVMGSVAASLILALAVISGAMAEQINYSRRKAIGADVPRRAPMSPLLLIVPCVGALILIVVGQPPIFEIARRMLLISLSCAIFLAQIYFLMRLLYPRIRYGAAPIALVAGVLWIAPLIIDGVYDAFNNYSSADPIGYVLMSSPVSMIYQLYKQHPPSATFGFCVQILILGFFILLNFLAGKPKYPSVIPPPMHAPLPQSAAALPLPPPV